MVNELTTETRSELDEIDKGTPDLERQIRAAAIGCCSAAGLGHAPGHLGAAG